MSNKRRARRPRPPRLGLDALAALLSSHSGVVVLEHRHEEGCPTIATQDADRCTCGDALEVYAVAPFGLRPRGQR